MPRHTLIVRVGGNDSFESTLTDHSSIFMEGVDGSEGPEGRTLNTGIT